MHKEESIRSSAAYYRVAGKVDKAARTCPRTVLTAEETAIEDLLVHTGMYCLGFIMQQQLGESVRKLSNDGRYVPPRDLSKGPGNVWLIDSSTSAT